MIATRVQAIQVSISTRDWLFSALQVLAASCFIALCAQIQIPLYFTPVPLSGQTLGIMLVAVTLGSRKGVLSVLAYIAEGCVGLPVFIGGASGIGCFVRATGGYFWGFLLQAYIIGWFAERRADSSKMLCALLISCAVQLGAGAWWLASFVGFERALVLGVYPFLPGEVLKAMGVLSYWKSRR